MYPGALPTDAPRSNLEWEVRDDLLVRDARGHGQDFKIENKRFCWVESASKILDFEDAEAAMNPYIEETL
jgi:hypothetical protein